MGTPLSIVKTDQIGVDSEGKLGTLIYGDPLMPPSAFVRSKLVLAKIQWLLRKRLVGKMVVIEYAYRLPTCLEMRLHAVAPIRTIRKLRLCLDDLADRTISWVM